MHQSVEVCRINSMFGGAAAGSKLRFNGFGGDSCSSSSTTSSSGHNGTGARYLLMTTAASTGDLRSTTAAMIGAEDSGIGLGVGGSATDLRNTAKIAKTAITSNRAMVQVGTVAEPKPLTDINHNSLAKWSAESITIELTSNGYIFGSKTAGSTDTLYRKDRRHLGSATAMDETLDSYGRSRSNSHSNSKSSQNYHHHQHHRNLHSSKTDLNRRAAAIDDQGRGDSQQRNIYEEVADGNNGHPIGGGQSIAEPIYAVVDLNVKKARRLNQLNGSLEEGGGGVKVEMVRDRETGRLEERAKNPNAIAPALPVSNNDYEELSELAMEHFTNFGDDPDNDGENIYEPINIPEGPFTSTTSLPSAPVNSSQMHSLWRNLKKMNLNQLIKRSNQEQPQPNQRPVEAGEDPAVVAAKASAFSELSRKFGHHRKSIKNRMRGVLVDRGGQPSPAGSESSSSAKMSHSDEKLRKTSSAHSQFFSTFGRNKKSRKSLSFDDFIPRKKHHQHHLNGVGVICKVDKTNDKLHRELKRQLSKRSDTSSSGGSSVPDNKAGGIEL